MKLARPHGSEATSASLRQVRSASESAMVSREIPFFALCLGGPFAVLFSVWWVSTQDDEWLSDEQRRRLRKETGLLALMAAVAIAALQLIGGVMPALDPLTRSSALQAEGSIAGVAVALVLCVRLLRRFGQQLSKSAFPGSAWQNYGRFFGFALAGWAFRFPVAVLGLLVGEAF